MILTTPIIGLPTILSLCLLFLGPATCLAQKGISETYQSPITSDKIEEGIQGAPSAHVRWPPNQDGKYVIQSEGIRLAFTNQGGTLTNLWVNGSDGREIDLVLGPDAVDEWANLKDGSTLGGVLGRYAGLVSGAGFENDSETFNTSANGHNGKAPVDGGDGSRGMLPLDVASHTENTLTFTVFEDMLGNANGLPGYLASSITHTVKPYEWTISFGATPLGTSAQVPIQLSQRVYLNLAGFRNQGKGVSEHTLHLPFSGLRHEMDTLSVPTGDIKGNKKDSEFDFWSAPKPLSMLASSRTINESFLISRPQPWNPDDRPVARLFSSLSGVQLDLFTDQEALRVETWKGETEKEASFQLKKHQGRGRAPQNAAIALTVQDWPDVLNHPEWQRDHKTMWGPDRIYTMCTKFRFSVKAGTTPGENPRTRRWW